MRVPPRVGPLTGNTDVTRIVMYSKVQDVGDSRTSLYA